jgi:hypothetical protein
MTVFMHRPIIMIRGDVVGAGHHVAAERRASWAVAG